MNASSAHRSLQRSPWTLAALEAVTAWGLLAVVAFLLGLAQWFWMQGEDVRLSAVPVNAATLLAASFGLPVALPSGTFSLFSPVLALLPALVLYRAARRTAEALTHNALRAGSAMWPVPAAAGTLVAVSLLVLTGAGALAGVLTDPEPLAAIRAAIVVVAATALGMAARLPHLGAAPTPREIVRGTFGDRLGEDLTTTLGSGLRSARDIAAGVLLLALVLTGGALWAGWAGVVEIQSAYETGPAGAAAMTALQLLFFTVPLAWSAAWMTGAGFAVGEGTRYHLLDVTTGPLPAIPALAALPQDEQPWGWAVPGLLLIAGALLAWRRLRGEPGRYWAVTALTVALFLGGALCSLLGSGSLGPGRLAEIGTPFWLAGLTLAVPPGLGAVTVLAVHDRRTRIQDGWERLGSSARERREQVREALRQKLG